ncbi:glycosyltransferase family 2 protein [Pelagovum pacificum]|uniref:Glycosyltransferase family 2 protein n=1 Tax=Pelagovum pacificum TaxID=2588711 RepID=A0A5C5G8X3_9RHOB|nr:glycosyltransferase family 2 protein [Pelagovum pacificum]QQA42088.1 glycosyltransferase family 2 protein [Pelagovum pacificum]TNY31176.1 glycosyltransferase family 2 protein [Pelagovum pacificum]
MRISAVTPMKNEGPFILEWLAYHRLIGFNDFTIFTNDCSDGTDLILERLDEMGLVRHLPNPSVVTDATNHHFLMMTYVDASPRLRRSDWFASFDVDEFWCINVGNGRLEDLFGAIGDADLVSGMQLDFGCSGHQTFDPDRLVIERFTHRAEVREAGPDGARKRGTKTIVRRGVPIRRIRNHSPLLEEGARDSVTWVNGSGEPFPPRMGRKGQIKSIGDPHLGADLVQLNHYALRSMEDFLMKSDRGNANHESLPPKFRYWRDYDSNAVEDLRLSSFASDVRDAVAELLKDDELARCHAASVDYRRRRIAELREEPEMARMHQQVRRFHRRRWQEPSDAG